MQRFLAFLMRWGSLAALLSVLWVVYDDVSSQDSTICSAPVFQNAISDACGDAGLGGRPSAEERLAWEALPAGDCEALRGHVARFPEGAFREIATDLLTARQTSARETWAPREAPVEVVIGFGDAAFASLAEARADALERAREDATGQCGSLVVTGRFRLLGASAREDALICTSGNGGRQCRYDGLAACAVEARRTDEIETCG